MAHLVLVRHAKSEWNALGLWTGWVDVRLSDVGEEEALKAAQQLKNITFHRAYSSKLQRARQTLEIIKGELALSNIPTIAHKALNERHYGIYTGKNKWDLQKEVGEAKFKKLRRSWNYPIPEGETLKNVHDRVVPYFRMRILADLRKNRNVLVVAHGNSLRALAKHLERLTIAEVAELEIGTGEAHIYEISEKGKMVSKEIRAKNASRGKV